LTSILDAIMDQRKAKKSAQPPPSEYWGLDPQDVRHHAKRMREARTVRPLGKFFRIAALALVLAGAFAAYWNRETLRELQFDFSTLTRGFSDAAEEVEDAARDGEPGTEVVGDTSVAGVSMPTSIKTDEEPEAEAPGAPDARADAPDARADAPAAAEPAPTPEPARPTETAAANESPPPPPPPEPEEPPRPETFGFGVEVMTVSEKDASARVLVLRDGGRRGVSFIRWWTTDGTAAAGSDFARLEPRTERFGVGEQNRTLLVPIIGDGNLEGPENFFIDIAVGESGAEPEPVARIEIMINDDD
jgi:Calx-beta domain